MKPSCIALFVLFLFPLLLSATEAVEVTAEPAHQLALSNEQARVFQVEVAPHASTLLHHHGHDYVFVTLGDSHVSNEVAGKPPVELKLSDGETRFTPGDFSHVARNLSDQPFRNVTVELMQDEKLRDAPSPWPQDSGDQEFPGGRTKVLLVRDGARVSTVELQQTLSQRRPVVGAAAEAVCRAGWPERELGASTLAPSSTPTPRRSTSSPPSQPVTRASRTASAVQRLCRRAVSASSSAPPAAGSAAPRAVQAGPPGRPRGRARARPRFRRRAG